MANSINEISRLLKRVVLTNLGTRDGENLTALVSGAHGIGKSQICKQIARDIGGYPIVIEASMLSEGDAVGLPVVSKLEDGSSEVTFVKHKAFAAVARLEKAYYEKAQKEGFLNGTIKLDADGDTVMLTGEKGKEEFVKVGHRDMAKLILDGEENRYKFGEDLPFEKKLELLEKKEIQPVVIMCDELNRTESQTMKELMNIVLNKTVNGYQLPWWCFIIAAQNPCSQNSSYAVNEMDGAQLDRFIKFTAVARDTDWVDHCLMAGINTDLVQAVTINSDLLMVKDKTLNDETPMTPSPRSWSMIATFMDYMHRINESAFFTAEERATLKEDFREVVFAKVGTEAGRAMLVNLDQKKNMIKPAEIFTCEAAQLGENVKKILNDQKPIQRKITMDSVVKYLCEHIHEMQKFGDNNDIKIRAKYTNFISQLTSYLELLDSATKTLFLKKIVEPGCKTTKGKLLFGEISKFISKDMLAILQSFLKDKKDVQ